MLVTKEEPELTVISIGLEVVTAPPLSVALAVNVYPPAPILFHGIEYGLVAAVPKSVDPAKKSTLATVPSLSLAVAFTMIFAGTVNVAPLAGLVILTVGF